ncbi:MAG TPA: hypothetical protein VI894_01855 [Candidatus Nanoarchaeia archaeon]|nr:hypothetical protein [Candidatus Nanoarchaeia archaeon]
MKTKHIFVAAVDIGELLPFIIKPTENLKESMEQHEKAMKELEKFIDKLEKNYKEEVWYMGMDIIAEKTWERYIFEKGGFFEIMVEAPLAMNAHFVHEKQAKTFAEALKKTLTSILPDNEVTKMFLDSIQVQSEEDESLTYKTWETMKNVRKG